MDVYRFVNPCFQGFAGFKGNYRILGLLIAAVVMSGWLCTSVFICGTGASIASDSNFCQNAFWCDCWMGIVKDSKSSV